MNYLVLLRHGESQWNRENRFTGFTDVDLNETGVTEAKRAGKLLEGIKFDKVYTSTLKRAYRTAELVLSEAGQILPMVKHDDLRERDYGDLTGLNKDETRQKFGAEQVQIWRRSYDIPPPPLGDDDPRHPRADRRYAKVDPRVLPASESLKDTLARVLPFWNDRIVPELLAGSNVLVVAHGNSLRAVVKMLDNVSEASITELNIPTGVPLVYELDANLKPIKSGYLGDPEAILAAAEAVKKQTEKKK